MKTIPDSLSPAQAWDRLSLCERLPVEIRDLPDCADHCLAEDFQVPEDVPAAPRSFMDGYAVRAADTAKLPAELQVAFEVAMGEIPSRKIGAGEAVDIPTGGFLPQGADCVVMQEDTERENGKLVVRRTMEPGENVQQRAEDFRKGQALYRAGHKLRAQDLAAMATFGAAQVSVVRRPVIRVISTGNELVPFQQGEAPAGKIRESNSLALIAAARKFGFQAAQHGIVIDELEAQRAAMEHALAESDVVLVSGGSSVGERDFTIPVIESFAVNRIHFHGLAIRPGNPTIFASIGSRFVFGLPGQPVSSLIVFYQFVLPFLLHLAGQHVDFDSFAMDTFPTLTARLQQSVKPLKTKTDYVRLKLMREGNAWSALPVLGKSASLSTLASADGFTIVPPGESSIPASTSVTVHLFP